MNKPVCPSCGDGVMERFLEIRSVPANSCILVPTREEALSYPLGDISLACCRGCGFIGNPDFDPALAEYSDRYEATQACSMTFQRFQMDFAKRLIDRHGIRGKKILEIGCGQGEFLKLLCELGGNRGVGFDPAYRPAKEGFCTDETVSIVGDYYSKKHSRGYEADLVCCKMTLEHIPNPLEFVRMVRSSLDARSGTIVFFQVPDATRILKGAAFEDIYYEHCSYFTPGSLKRLFRLSGFEVIHLETIFEGQYLTIEAMPSNEGQGAFGDHAEDLSAIGRLVESFQVAFEDKLTAWKRRVRDRITQGQRVVLWGSGSKASAFTTLLGLAEDLDPVVDINPKKHGYYMAGTGQKIVPPGFLRELRPDTVIVMNAVYIDEIRRQLAGMGVEADLLSL